MLSESWSSLGRMRHGQDAGRAAPKGAALWQAQGGQEGFRPGCVRIGDRANRLDARNVFAISGAGAAVL